MIQSRSYHITHDESGSTRFQIFDASARSHTALGEALRQHITLATPSLFVIDLTMTSVYSASFLRTFIDIASCAVKDSLSVSVICRKDSGILSAIQFLDLGQWLDVEELDIESNQATEIECGDEMHMLIETTDKAA